MKVSRFEPHILAPLADNNDLDVFMKDLESESEHITAAKASSTTPDGEDSGEEVKRGLLRFVEALGRHTPRQNRDRKRTTKKTLKSMALDRYETQKSFNIDNFTRYSKNI
jgi:hypothetical protein